jgi:hypothetical protein
MKNICQGSVDGVLWEENSWGGQRFIPMSAQRIDKKVTIFSIPSPLILNRQAVGPLFLGRWAAV